MKHDKDRGAVTLLQFFLIEKIITLLGEAVEDANTKSTPSVFKEILCYGTDGLEQKQSWKYRSAIDMLNYLSVST